jgi:hypothetical protein
MKMGKRNGKRKKDSKITGPGGAGTAPRTVGARAHTPEREGGDGVRGKEEGGPRQGRTERELGLHLVPN